MMKMLSVVTCKNPRIETYHTTSLTLPSTVDNTHFKARIIYASTSKLTSNLYTSIFGTSSALFNMKHVIGIPNIDTSRDKM